MCKRLKKKNALLRCSWWSTWRFNWMCLVIYKYLPKYTPKITLWYLYKNALKVHSRSNWRVQLNIWGILKDAYAYLVLLLVNKNAKKRFSRNWTRGGHSMLHLKAHLRCTLREYLKMYKKVRKKIYLKLQLMVHLKVQLRLHLRVHLKMHARMP